MEIKSGKVKNIHNCLEYQGKSRKLDMPWKMLTVFFFFYFLNGSGLSDGEPYLVL